MTIDPAPSNNPVVFVSYPIVHLAWHDERDGNKEIYYKRSTDGGLTWSADTRLTNAAGISGRPAISVSGQALHLAWYDERDGNAELYYKQDPTANTVGLDELAASAPLFSVHPNPANSDLTIDFAGMVQQGSIELTSVLGETVYRASFMGISTKRIQLMDVPNGMYFLTVYDGQRSGSQKIMIGR